MHGWFSGFNLKGFHVRFPTIVALMASATIILIQLASVCLGSNQNQSSNGGLEIGQMGV